MKEVKQYIILRSDLNMSPGKMAAQASHASMKVFFDKLEHRLEDPWFTRILCFDDAELEWIDGTFTKIVKKVKNEGQLLKAYNQAKELGLNCSLIEDLGFTELEGKNYTAVAIGPNYVVDCEPVVKKLRNL